MPSPAARSSASATRRSVVSVSSIGGRAELPQRGVECFPGDVLLRKVRRDAFNAGGQRSGHAGMARLIGGQILELDRKLSSLFRRDLVEAGMP